MVAATGARTHSFLRSSRLAWRNGSSRVDANSANAALLVAVEAVVVVVVVAMVTWSPPTLSTP